VVEVFAKAAELTICIIQNHITRHYDSIVAPLAHQTFFIQPHFAWDWIFSARLEKVVTDATGFVSFGPYLNASCTADGSEIDSHGQSHPRIAQIYSAFQGDLCPADGFTVSVEDGVVMAVAYDS
jgi:hypothetical protein